jgi:hypothetical protein
MAQWQAPSTNNERTPDDVGVLTQAAARPYLDAVTGRVLWWTGFDALPVGATPLFMVIRVADAVRVLSDDNADERAAVLFGTSRILIR